MMVTPLMFSICNQSVVSKWMSMLRELLGLDARSLVASHAMTARIITPARQTPLAFRALVSSPSLH